MGPWFSISKGILTELPRLPSSVPSMKMMSPSLAMILIMYFPEDKDNRSREICEWVIKA